MPDLTGELALLDAWANDPARKIVAHLAKSPITVTADQVQLTDLVEADFPGYAAVLIDEWDPTDFGDDTYGEVTSGEVQWQASTLTVPQSVYVAYCTVEEFGNPPALFQPVVLPIPFTFVQPGQTFAFLFRIAAATLASLDDADSPQ